MGRRRSPKCQSYVINLLAKRGRGQNSSKFCQHSLWMPPKSNRGTKRDIVNCGVIPASGLGSTRLVSPSFRFVAGSTGCDQLLLLLEEQLNKELENHRRILCVWVVAMVTTVSHFILTML